MAEGNQLVRENLQKEWTDHVLGWDFSADKLL